MQFLPTGCLGQDLQSRMRTDGVQRFSHIFLRLRSRVSGLCASKTAVGYPDSKHMRKSPFCKSVLGYRPSSFRLLRHVSGSYASSDRTGIRYLTAVTTKAKPISWNQKQYTAGLVSISPTLIKGDPSGKGGLLYCFDANECFTETAVCVIFSPIHPLPCFQINLWVLVISRMGHMYDPELGV